MSFESRAAIVNSLRERLGLGVGEIDALLKGYEQTTLTDQFAMAALTGLLSNATMMEHIDVAASVYGITDPFKMPMFLCTIAYQYAAFMAEVRRAGPVETLKTLIDKPENNGG